MLLIGLVLFCFILFQIWRGVMGIIRIEAGEDAKKRAVLISKILLAVVILFFIGDEIYTKKQFEQLCKKEAGLKIYKKVGNVDGFLYMSDKHNNPEYYKQFKFYENVDSENKYKIKEYYTKKENNQYIIDHFLVMTERKYIGKGEYKETLIKENRIYFDKYKINRYSFTNNDEYSKEENVQPISRYVLINVYQHLSDRFDISKTLIIDTKDYSVIAEYSLMGSGGGKFLHFLSSFYGGGYVNQCGLVQGKVIDPSNFIKQIFN